ncbi:MAG: hypothetical protein Q9174_007227, partial [Haloplaca sp. 1 TL-2023]
MYRSSLALAVAFSALSSALPQVSPGKTLTGYATFNDYGAQKTGVNCIPELYQNLGTQKLVDNQKIFGAATNDGAQGLGPYKCEYSEKDNRSDPAQCTVSKDGLPYKLPSDDASSPDFYKPPFCPGAQCGKCYTVTNRANNKKITVQILDACPAQTAWNYCKAGSIPANQRCGDAGTNQVDIDLSAYPVLSGGQAYESGKTPNLDIDIGDHPG